MTTLLVVEDDPTINQALTDRLTAEGFTVVQAWDGPGAVAAHDREHPDLVVLDVMLPGIDGLEVCRRIQAGRPVPVLMLTARVEETDMLVGLGVGADDYVTKPFSTREVVARIRALLRRVERAHELAGAPAPVLAVGDLTVDTGARRVHVGPQEVHLTPLEFDLLHHLARRPGVVFPREQLLREVWGYRDGAGPRTVDSHVRGLRRKLGADLIRTVRGSGYALRRPE